MLIGPTTAGLLFGPSCNGKTYLSMYTHRGTRASKSQWARDVTPEDEFKLFDCSDSQDRYDARGHYWSFMSPDGSQALGTQRERIAKHPAVSNMDDPWHGYPVSPKNDRDGSDVPTDELIERLENSGQITRTFAARLRGRRI